MSTEPIAFPDRPFIVSYYTPRRRVLLLVSQAVWGYEETVRAAFFGVTEFLVSQALRGLRVGEPEPYEGGDGGLRHYPVFWESGSGYVIARKVDTEAVRGISSSIFQDRWGILARGPPLPPDWSGS